MSERDIRFAYPGEEEEIINFLAENWHPEFSVVKSRELFDFLYKGNDGPNFIVAFDGVSLVGTLGLIFYGENKDDASLTLWRSVDSRTNTGFEMLKFALAQGYNSLTSVGTRPEVLPFYRLLKFNTGEMEHWVRINSKIDHFTILEPGQIVQTALSGECSGFYCREVETFSPKFSYFSTPSDGTPFKSWSYLEKRYLRHPIYQYRVFEVGSEGTVLNYFVTRTVHHEGASALRLVDCVADETGLQTFARFVDHLLVEESLEYIDLYCMNLDSSELDKAGFVSCSKVQGLIVPNYFEPFVRQAETKHYVSTLPKPRLYKGDGDADRPFRLDYVDS